MLSSRTLGLVAHCDGAPAFAARPASYTVELFDAMSLAQISARCLVPASGGSG